MGVLTINATKNAYYEERTSAVSTSGISWGSLSPYGGEYQAAVFIDLSFFAGKTINSAYLRMFLSSDDSFLSPNALGYTIRRITQNWSQTNGSPWPTVTTSGQMDDTIPFSGSYRIRDVNITDFVRNIVYNSLPYYGIALERTGSTVSNLKTAGSIIWGNPMQFIIDYVGGGVKGRVGGVWRDSEIFARIGGRWRPGQMFTRVGGVWRPGQ